MSIHEEVLSLHIGVHSVPNDKNLTSADVEYFWYSVASVITCHKPEWLTQEAFDFLNDYETEGETEDGSTESA
jgi:hypothetical protein